MEEFANLKLPELRKECKARGLSVSGNKPDLVSRLQAALTTEKPPSDDSVLDDALIDEDSMLGDDDSSAEGEDSTDLADLTTNAIDLCSPTSKIAPVSISKVSPVKMPVSPVKKVEAVKRAAPSSPLKPGIQTNGAGDKSTTSPPTKKKITINREPVEAPVGVTEPVKAPGETDEEEGEKKVVKIDSVAPLSAEEKAKLRAQKFGLAVTSAATAVVVANASAAPIAPITDEKLKKRMERFNNGAGVTTTNANSVVSLTTEDDIKLAKRKERFGIGNEEVKKETRAARFCATPSATPATDSDSTDKKQLRAARFGNTT